MNEDNTKSLYVLKKSYLYSAMTDISFDVNRLFTSSQPPIGTSDTPQFITSLNHLVVTHQPLSQLTTIFFSLFLLGGVREGEALTHPLVWNPLFFHSSSSNNRIIFFVLV